MDSWVGDLKAVRWFSIYKRIQICHFFLHFFLPRAAGTRTTCTAADKNGRMTVTWRNQRRHLFVFTCESQAEACLCLHLPQTHRLFFHRLSLSLSETCSNQSPKEAWILKLQTWWDFTVSMQSHGTEPRYLPCFPPSLLAVAASLEHRLIPKHVEWFFFSRLLFFVWNSVRMFKDDIKWRKICHQLPHAHCRSHAGTQSSSATQLCDLIKYLAGACGWPFHLCLTPLLRELPPARNQATAPLMRSEVRQPSVSRARGCDECPCVCVRTSQIFFLFVLPSDALCSSEKHLLSSYRWGRNSFTVRSDFIELKVDISALSKFLIAFPFQSLTST